MLRQIEIQKLLRDACDQAGSVKAWAKAQGVSWSHVYDVIRGRKVPGKKILRCLGYRKVIRFEPIERKVTCPNKN